MCFFKIKHFIGYISGIRMVGPFDMKRKGCSLGGYWVNYVTLTVNLTYDLDLGFFKVEFRNSCISGIVRRMWSEREVYQLDTGLTTWPCPFWPHLWPWSWSFRVKVSNSLISGLGGLIYMYERDVSRPFSHDHDIDLCVTMAGWVDVPDSDRGDFIRRRAVGISSYNRFH